MALIGTSGRFDTWHGTVRFHVEGQWVAVSFLDDIDANRLSDRDYKRISDEHLRATNDTHNVTPWDRIVALRRESCLMTEYEQAQAVRTHSDREAESKWLVAQILPDDMRGGQ